MPRPQRMQAAPPGTGQGEAPRRRRQRHDMTLDDVARAAGVSPITVSRALHKPDMVSADTAARVRQAVERLGYVPNLLAGGLASNRSRLVMAVIPTTINPTFSEMIDSVRDELAHAGYQLMIGLSGYDDAREEQLLNAIVSRRPDGILLTGVAHSPAMRRMLVNARIPVVETWDMTPEPIDMLVGFSNEGAGRAAAEYFIGKGRRNLALIIGSDMRARARRDGFMAAAKARGARVVACDVIPSPTTAGGGRAAIRRMLDRHPETDAVFCTSDQLALGILLEGIAGGIAIPERLAVMGFGNLNFSADTVPALTTVAVDGERVGRQAARLLLERIGGEARDGERVVDVGFRIIERESA